MGVARFESETPFDHVRLYIATVLCRTDRGNLHAGLLYSGPNNTRCALHLGWQDRLYDQWESPVLWATPEIEPEQLFTAAALCRHIWEAFMKEKAFPWALRDLGARFDAKGHLVLTQGAHGLTCATIILAIFDFAGAELVVRDTWPIRRQQDREWLEWAYNEGFFREAAHYELIRAEVEEGVPRVLPDEIVAACACVVPARFSTVRFAARVLVDKLNGDRSLRARCRRLLQWAKRKLGWQ